jgi:subtilase family serine protease
MFRTRWIVSFIGATAVAVGMTVAGASGQAGAATAGGPRAIPGSAAPFTAHTQVIGSVAKSKRLTVQVWLKPRLAAAEQYASLVSTPGTSSYRHFLSPSGYAARFGATRSAAGKVASWLRGNGFTKISTDTARDYVRATGDVSRIDAAFRTQLKLYKSSPSVNAGPYQLRANDRAVRLPASIAGLVIGVTGLDNAAPHLPLVGPGRLSRFARKPVHRRKPPHFKCSSYYGQHMIKNLPLRFGTTTFPTYMCGYNADQLRAAYGANWQNTGKGQTVALVELGLTRDMFGTLVDYAAANHLPTPTPGRYAELSLGEGSACGDPFDVEEQLDVEASYDMAPGAHQLVVGGDSCNFGDYGLQGLFNADIAILNGAGDHPLASIASNSWGGFDESQPPMLTNIEHAYLVRAVDEGVGMYFAAGDASGNETPATDPYVTTVGGTTLGLGRTDQRLFETGWSTGISLLFKHQWIFLGEDYASGGGPSEIWSEPSYQDGIVPTQLATSPVGDRPGLVRSVPDLGADADPFTGFDVGLLTFHKKGPATYAETDVGGTSEATPLVAGIVAAAQQGQPVPFGFINPAIYRLAASDPGAFHDALPLTSASPAEYRGTVCDVYACGLESITTFDDQNPNMAGYFGQVTLPGYDNMTGIGTPNGQAFITGLRGLGG